MQRLSEHVKCHCKKYITIRHSNINLKDGAYFVVRSTRALKLQSLLKIYDGQGLFLGWVFFLQGWSEPWFLWRQRGKLILLLLICARKMFQLPAFMGKRCPVLLAVSLSLYIYRGTDCDITWLTEP